MVTNSRPRWIRDALRQRVRLLPRVAFIELRRDATASASQPRYLVATSPRLGIRRRKARGQVSGRKMAIPLSITALMKQQRICRTRCSLLAARRGTLKAALL